MYPNTRGAKRKASSAVQAQPSSATGTKKKIDTIKQLNLWREDEQLEDDQLAGCSHTVHHSDESANGTTNKTKQPAAKRAKKEKLQIDTPKTSKGKNQFPIHIGTAWSQ